MPQSRFVIEICDKWTGCELLLGTKGLVRQAARSLKFFTVFVFFFVCLFVYVLLHNKCMFIKRKMVNVELCNVTTL